MEYIFQKDIKVNYKISHLQIIKFVLTAWLTKPNKIKYIKSFLENDTLKTLLVKHEYGTFEKLKSQLRMVST